MLLGWFQFLLEKTQENSTFFAFGGAGPMHACALAKELDIPKVFIPARQG